MSEDTDKDILSATTTTDEFFSAIYTVTKEAYRKKLLTTRQYLLLTIACEVPTYTKEEAEERDILYPETTHSNDKSGSKH